MLVEAGFWLLVRPDEAVLVKGGFRCSVETGDEGIDVRVACCARVCCAPSRICP